VWVQPAARVLHLEGLSHSRSTEQGLKTHQLRNLEQLQQQWQFTLDTQQPPADHPWLLAADRQLLGRPLALLLQPTAQAITTCRQRGYGVLALGESPQADVLALPLGWRDLERWLLEQLPAGGPEVVLVGALEGEVGELAERLQQARPQWGLVASPSALPPQADGMLLPALLGWDREDLRILASSSGLHADGWLESPSRLVMQLVGDEEPAHRLRPWLYLPDQGLLVEQPMALIETGSAAETLSHELQPGLNAVVVMLSRSYAIAWRMMSARQRLRCWAAASSSAPRASDSRTVTGTMANTMKSRRSQQLYPKSHSALRCREDLLSQPVRHRAGLRSQSERYRRQGGAHGRSIRLG